jgi:hypothetical protein
MAPMADCEHHAGKSAPAKGLDCVRDCPLLCAAIAARPSALQAPVRPYARLRYDTSAPDREGAAAIRNTRRPERSRPEAFERNSNLETKT